MDPGLKGKHVIVTGGSKGIGREICRAFLAEGAQVSLCARDAAQIEATVSELSPLGTICGSSLDVADAAAVAGWVTDTAARSGGIDCVVSNASALSVGAAEENWRQGLEIDILLSKGLARQHAASGVRFNTVSPGTVYFDGGIWQRVEQGMPEYYKQTLARNPTGRMASPAEVASAVVFLSSPRSSFRTGTNLIIDGALTQRVDY